MTEIFAPYKWEALFARWPDILAAFGMTAAISALALVIALVLGFVFGVFAVSRFRILRALTRVYVETVQNIPLLLQVFVLYAVFPLLGLTIASFWIGVIAIGAYHGGYMSEVVRSGIGSVHRGQFEAAKSQGFSPVQTMTLIILPQAMRIILPPLAVQAANLVKNTSVLALIAGALGGKAGFLTNLDGIVRAPLQKAATVTAQWLESIYGYIYKYDQLKAENDQLRVQLAEAQAQAREGQEALAENERYRELLGFTQRHTDFELEPANVVSYGASNWSSTLTLSKGSDCGIEVGDCVMNEAGALVGQVIEVGSTWATVRTVIDVDMSVGGYISSSGATAMVLGDFTLMQDGCVRFGYLAEGTSIFTGDTVLTSGKGGAFPAGLVVGTITDVRTEAGGQQTYGVITPACDLGELLQVFVIKDFDVVS